MLPAAEPEALFAAPPALVTAAPPGEHCFVASATGPSPEPGRYVTVCFIPTGADPQAYFAALKAKPGHILGRRRPTPPLQRHVRRTRRRVTGTSEAPRLGRRRRSANYSTRIADFSRLVICRVLQIWVLSPPLASRLLPGPVLMGVRFE